MGTNAEMISKSIETETKRIEILNEKLSKLSLEKKIIEEKFNTELSKIIEKINNVENSISSGKMFITRKEDELKNSDV